MPRIEPLHEDEVAPSLREVVAQARVQLPLFMNQILTLAHRPRPAHDLVTLYLGFQEDSRMDQRLIELAVLTVSYENRCAYCVSHHMPLGVKAGLTVEALADLETGRGAHSTHFSDVEKLIIAYATQITQEARRVPSTLFDSLCEHFDSDQIVELTIRIALANFFNHLNDALQIELEPGVEPLLR